MSELAKALERLRIVDSYGIEWKNMLQDKDTDPQMLTDIVTVVRWALSITREKWRDEPHEVLSKT